MYHDMVFKIIEIENGFLFKLSTDHFSKRIKNSLQRYSPGPIQCESTWPLYAEEIFRIATEYIDYSAANPPQRSFFAPKS